MSMQFGRWNFEGPAPAMEYIEKVNATLAPFGPDSNESYSKDGVKILYRSFCTTKESRRETQPYVFASGAVLTWDGRLDNRAELIGDLTSAVSINSTDVEIVAAAFERWGDKCPGRLIGDWALSIWNPRERSLLLAKDPIGLRHLYYTLEKDYVAWSTILDPLVLFAEKTFVICEEYIAAWLTNQFPATHLTPYVGIQAVPPSCCVLLRPGKHGTKRTITRYWDFSPDKRIRYRTDAEYEEHFRLIFAHAVQRSLRSDRPVLAELSGGMDSSSIVCMADLIMRVGVQEGPRHSPLAISPMGCPRLDTISWGTDLYEHLEPDTNEFNWVSKVEERRGRIGFHINSNELRSVKAKSPKPFMSAFDSGGFASTPAPKTLSRFFQLYAAHIASQGYRVTISGVGGDHVTGKERTPIPELQNFIVRGRFGSLTRQLNAWAITTRKSCTLLLQEAVREFFPRPKIPNDIFNASWFHCDFIKRNHTALCDCPTRVKFLGPLPSFQHSVAGLEAERRLAACWELNPHLIREVRYPYLDRDFLEFMYAIPCGQVVRPGAYRYLMKRSLVGIVPNELLNRKRKVFVRPESDRDKENKKLSEMPGSVHSGQQMVSSLMGIIDLNRFLDVVQTVNHKDEALMRMLLRTLRLESWLRHLAHHAIVATPKAINGEGYPSRAGEVVASG